LSPKQGFASVFVNPSQNLEAVIESSKLRVGCRAMRGVYPKVLERNFMPSAVVARGRLASVSLAAALVLFLAMAAQASEVEAQLIGPWKIVASNKTDNGKNSGQAAGWYVDGVLKLRKDGTSERTTGLEAKSFVLDSLLPEKSTWSYNENERELVLGKIPYKVRFVEGKLRLSRKFTSIYLASSTEEILLIPDD
jgi:hypothetical protein